MGIPSESHVQTNETLVYNSDKEQFYNTIFRKYKQCVEICEGIHSYNLPIIHEHITARKRI